MRGPAVDKAFRQTFMKTVRQPVLDRARTILPLRGVVCPVRTVCDIGPCANIGKAGHQCIDITIKAIELIHRPRHHIIAKLPVPRQRHEQPGQQVVMIVIQALPKIRNTGNIP